MQISAIPDVSAVSASFSAQPAAAPAKNPSTGFGQLMEEMVGKVGEMQNDADRAIQDLATGQGQGLHEVMLAVEKASVSFQMLTQVRNKAVEAYQEIMRMPV